MNYDIVSIGSATQDVFLSANGFEIISSDTFAVGKGMCIPFGSKVPIQKILFASGGGGTNAAVTFARQGLKTGCIAVIGKDANGTSILDELRREGVDGKYIQIHHDDSTAYSVILVSDTGERTILSYKGEGAHWNVAAVPWDQIDCGWMYVNSLGGHFDVLERIVAEAQRTGRHLATNPGGKELEAGLQTLARHWKKFDIVGMNQEEAAQLTGVSFEKRDDIFRIMDEAIGGIFIMTRGGEGVHVSDGHYLYTAGIPNRDVVERTGAGDAFHAAFVAEFIRSGNIEKAIQLATANSTSVVMQYGAKAGILRKGDTGMVPLVAVERRPLQ
jgi:ribokinase